MYRATKDIHRLNQPVGLGNNAPIDTSGGMFIGCPMVFYRLSHDFDLFFREPFAKSLVGPYQSTRNQVMVLASFAQAEVMASRYGIYHALIDFIMRGQFQAFGNDLSHMVDAMGLVECFVSGDDFGFEMINQGKFTTAQIDKNTWTEEMLDMLLEWIRTDPRGEEYRQLDWSKEYDLARNGDPTDTQSAL